MGLGLQLHADEVVGAFVEGSHTDSFRVWHCPVDERSDQRKPVRCAAPARCNLSASNDSSPRLLNALIPLSRSDIMHTSSRWPADLSIYLSAYL